MRGPHCEILKATSRSAIFVRACVRSKAPMMFYPYALKTAFGGYLPWGDITVGGVQYRGGIS